MKMHLLSKRKEVIFQLANYEWNPPQLPVSNQGYPFPVSVFNLWCDIASRSQLTM